MQDLKRKTVLGGGARLASQAVGLTLRLVFLVVMARFLSPADFGLVAMVTAITGFIETFRDGGLSAAAIQQPHLTEDQKSALFWVNLSLGAFLTLLCAALAPVLAHFYNEPRLFWVTITLSGGFIIGAAGAQHSAMLERELRYQVLAFLEVIGVLVYTCLAIAMAVAGFGYWSLVVSALVMPTVTTTGVWTILRWIPRMPRRSAGIHSMLRFGGTLTLNCLVVYVAYNLDKILLGRFWGADVLGIYTRAYQIINIPQYQLSNAIGSVGFSSLSRLQHDAVKYKDFFLKGYSLVITLTAPITLFSAAFSEDIVLVFLGPKWVEASTIFRLLAPTILIFGIINPLGWLLFSTGRQKRSLHTAMVIAPLCAAAYVIGLPYGGAGVALAFSAAMTLWMVPHIIWCLKDTTISPRDLFLAMWPALGSAIVAASVSFIAVAYAADGVKPWLRLLFGGCVVSAVYAFMLLFVMEKKSFYLGLLWQFGPRAS
jgi:PST family polysaccharide transporter